MKENTIRLPVIVDDEPEHAANDNTLDGRATEAELAALDDLRPRTRADCLPGGCNAVRPCFWISCRHHLGLSADEDGALRSSEAGGPLRPSASARQVDRWGDRVVEGIATMDDTCSLDAADRGPHTLQEVADAFGWTRERARQIEVRALRRLRVGGGLDEFEDHEPPEHFSSIAQFEAEK
jgi:hypothetical protein